jgi:hypothetical protein
MFPSRELIQKHLPACFKYPWCDRLFWNICPVI